MTIAMFAAIRIVARISEGAGGRPHRSPGASSSPTPSPLAAYPEAAMGGVEP